MLIAIHIESIALHMHLEKYVEGKEPRIIEQALYYHVSKGMRPCLKEIESRNRASGEPQFLLLLCVVSTGKTLSCEC